MTRLTSVCLALSLLLVAGAGAADHPSIARGINSDSVFRSSGIEHINLFNGNLMLTVPLGTEYPVGGNLSYRFMLVHNAKTWDFRENTYSTLPTFCCDGETFTRSFPNRTSNAGFGWRMGLASLHQFDRDDASNPGLPYLLEEDLTFELPDGGSHVLAPASDGALYSYDGSHLRARINGTHRYIDLPNGTIYHFVGTYNPAAQQNEDYRLTEVTDVFGNWVHVTYTGNDWDVTDSQGRTHHIVTRAVSGQTSGNYANVIATLDTQGFQGRRWKYDFTYTDGQTFAYPCGDHLPEHTQNYATQPLPTLDAISAREDASSGISAFSQQLYSFAYNLDHDRHNCETGTIQSVTLPTHGVMEYQYEALHVESAYCDKGGWATTAVQNR